MKLMSVVGKEEIEKRINIIFDVEERNRKDYERTHYEDVDDEENTKRSYFKLKSEDNFASHWDTYTTLKQLYVSIERVSLCRNTFISIIENKLSALNLDSALAFYFLLKIGSNDIIIRALNSKILGSMTSKTLPRRRDRDIGEQKEHKLYRYGKEVGILCGDISVFMHLEPSYFDESFVGQLEEIMNYNYGWNIAHKQDFKNEVLTLSYNRLVNELKGNNEELNIHKETVIGMISKYGFPSDMQVYLLEIDKLPDHLSDWQTINSGMIANLRSFFEVLVKGIAAKIKTKTRKEYPKDSNKGEMGNKRAYIKEHLGLSSKDNRLIDSFVDILVTEGGHALTSDKKHFLLTKNVGIELAYFLLSTYEEKFETRA